MGRIKEKVLCRMIASADSAELNEIALAVMHRYNDLFSEDEVVFLSLPKHDPKERQRIIHAILHIEQHQDS